MIKVSIAVPVYNSDKYLSECLDSLTKQTYSNIEIICVNDGSTDDSLSILHEYEKKDNRIKVFTKENEGKGAASARNIGLANATGEYIQFLDSDDFFELDMVEKLVKKVTETDADVVIYRANRYDDRLKKVTQPYVSIELQNAPSNDPFNMMDCPEKIFQVGDLIAWNKMYKMELLREYDLKFEPIPISDDQYVPALALIFAKKITYIDEAFINYRFNTGNSQVDTLPKHPEAAYQATFSIVKRMREVGIYDKIKRSYLNMAMRLMREYFDKMTSLETLKFLYDKYRDEVFPMLDAEGLSVEFFYDARIGEWYKMITSMSLDEILFKACRAYGSGMTTAILRFQMPYEKMPKGKKIVLIGKELITRYWHAQMVFSDYCSVVGRYRSESEIPPNLEYDEIVIAN